MKKIISIILLVIWMIVIFMFSNQDNEDSKKISENVINKTIEATSSVTKKNISENDKKSIVDNSITYVRKSAHFFEYLVLGLLMINVLRFYMVFDKKIIILSMLLCVLYSISDEIHQLFIYGRSAEVFDTLIDSIGSSMGIIIYSLIYKIKA